MGDPSSHFTTAADAAVQAILACEISESHIRDIIAPFNSIICLRVCFTSVSKDDVFVSSNLLDRGEVLFTPVEASSSCSRQVATACRPAFLTGYNVAAYSDFALPLRQNIATAQFCVPFPPTLSSSSAGQSSSDVTTPAEKECIGALLVGFESEETVQERDLRSTLLLAREISLHHQASLENLIAGIAPLLSPYGDRDHAQWGDAGGLIQQPMVPPQRIILSRPPPGRSAAAAAAAGGSGSRNRNGVQRTSAGRQRHSISSNGSRVRRENGGGDEYDEDEDNEDSDDGEEDVLQIGYSGGFILTPVQHKLLEKANPLTLVFPSTYLEGAYQEWRRARMARVDIAALATLLAYHATRTTTTTTTTTTTSLSSSVESEASGVSSSSSSSTSFFEYFLSYLRNMMLHGSVRGFEWVPCVALALPLVLAKLPFTRKAYYQWRDVLIACVYIILAWHHTVGVRRGAAQAEQQAETISQKPQLLLSLLDSGGIKHFIQSCTSAIVQLVSSTNGAWIALLSIILHIQHPWQVVLLMTVALGTVLGSPLSCPAAGAALLLCWGAFIAQTLVVQIVWPVVVLYLLEYGARRAFCATPVATTYAWDLELSRN